MSGTGEKIDNEKGPSSARVNEAIEQLKAIPENEELARRAAEAEGAIAFVHFDPTPVKSHIVQALVHGNDLTKVHRGMYVHITSIKDDRHYSGRIVEGPFYNPDALRRDSTPVQFIILNQGKGKVLAVPEYHGWVQIEILGQEHNGSLSGAVRRPHPASPVLPYDSTMMSAMLNLDGNIRLGLLDNYEEIFVQVDGDNKGVVPRNWLTVGTIGSGKTNTCQVFIEETLAAGYAQVVVDPEGEYIFMDQPSSVAYIDEHLKQFGRASRGVGRITVYRPPLSESRRNDAIEFSIPFDSLSPEIIIELTEMNTAQQTRFTFLYEQAIQIARKERGSAAAIESEDIDLSMGYPGVTLGWLLRMLEQEFQYYNWKREHKKSAKPRRKASDADGADREADQDAAEMEMKIYCHKYQLEPLIQDQTDVSSYGALRKKLRELQMMNIFDRKDAPPLDVERLSEPGHLSVIDMSDSREQQVVNIVIADLLARMYHYKMGLTEEENTERRVFLTIEEAHGFVSRERQNKMEQTLDQLRRIARRGRKRWLALHFVTQSPQHLPSELFELANNKIIHQTTGAENLRVLKAAAGTVNEAVWEDVPSLGKGRAIIVSSQYPHPLIAQIRPASSKRNYMI
jgi:DNA helicase HerA-like ATPase